VCVCMALFFFMAESYSSVCVCVCVCVYSSGKTIALTVWTFVGKVIIHCLGLS